jgi:CRP-like cAMP-binding protein
MVTSNVKPSVSLLKEIKLLQSFSEAELQQLIASGSGASYEPHTNIVIEGELSWGLYLIVDGIVGIFKTNKLTGSLYDVGQLRAGSFFGEMSLIDENPRSATVRSLTNCELFYISKETFIAFLNKSTDLKLKFYQNCVSNLVVRLRELDDNYVISQYQLWQSALKKEEK